MTVSSLGASTSAYSYLQSLLPQQPCQSPMCSNLQRRETQRVFEHLPRSLGLTLACPCLRELSCGSSPAGTELQGSLK